ncbi:hypothetical protein GKZ90_0025665, partial [Flavobacterium sp. MC2016-06]|uniref:hypothetical protein n=1 Tax=Flavobacterium sp. MC2016-06 TaxID=2676308 RepID=UPI0031D3EDE9
IAVTVVQPAVLDITLVSNINANCNSKAKVTVTTTGGVPAYLYAFVQDGATPIASDYTTSATAELDPAVNTQWDVYVKDANLICSDKLDVTIATDALPIIVMPAAQCYVGTPLTIDLSIGQTVAVAPAKYTVNGAIQPSSTYTITAPGIYRLGIIDGNGCTSNFVDYTVYPQVLLQADLAQDLTCIANATINLTPTGGTGTYTKYEVDGGSGYTVIAGPAYTASVAGTYVFRVTDSQNCTAVSSTITVTPTTSPTA